MPHRVFPRWMISHILQTQAAKKAGGCRYLGASARHQAAFRDSLLAVPSDVEELAAAGRRKSICPYYSARRAAPDADLLLVPYGSLLLKVQSASGIQGYQRTSISHDQQCHGHAGKMGEAVASPLR